MMVATTGAALAVISAAHGMDAYFNTFNGCATGRDTARLQVQILPPLASTLPVVGRLMATGGAVAAAVCRAALWAGLVAWIGAFACIVCWP